MAAECGKAAGMTDRDAGRLFDLGMLHDIGVSSTSTHKSLLAEFDWEGSQAHCLAGYELLRNFAPLADLALPIRYHHTRWTALATADLAPEVARQANLTFLVDRVDTLAAPFYSNNSLLLHVAEIRDAIDARRGDYFSADLVDQFLATSQAEAFWLCLEPRSIQAYLQDRLSETMPYQANMAQLRQLAQIFSRIVDAKSVFTARHSTGVASLARLLAGKMGVCAEDCDKLEIAGLLHDLGKLRIPDEILDKPGKLDPDERKIINAHAFETYQILRHIKGFENITLWASYHHEEPGGNGYPFHLRAETLPLECRILRAADIFQALVQDRPYRHGMEPDAVVSVLRELATAGRLERDILEVLESSIDEVMAAAMPPP